MLNRVAVIIVNYNGGEFLRQCLAALSRQAVPPARIIVMDNGSRDGSIGVCKAEHPSVEFHELGVNHGFAKANNLAVAMVGDCEWVALLNPDAFAQPDWVEKFQRHAAEHPDTDMYACCMLRAADPRIIDGAGDEYRVDGLAWPRGQGALAETLSAITEEVFLPSAGAAFLRRSAFLDAGGFCERYFCYYEDVDLGFRLRLLGYRCLFLPDCIVHHVGSALTGIGSPFSVYHAHRNFVWTYFRNMPGGLVWFYLPAHLAANLASIALFIRKGLGRTIFRAKWDALMGLPQTLRERRQIQTRRRVPPDAILAKLRRGNLILSLFRRALRGVGLSST